MCSIENNFSNIINKHIKTLHNDCSNHLNVPGTLPVRETPRSSTLLCRLIAGVGGALVDVSKTWLKLQILTSNIC